MKAALMQINIKLMGMLAAQTPSDGVLELAHGASIEDALVALDIPVDSVAAFTVNGSLVKDRAQTLAESDSLTVLPPVGGG